MREQSIHHLLWTGGWDSTFRLLQLLLLLEKPVQPHYLIDSERKSTGAELKTHSRIKQRLLEKYPRIESLLLPVQQYEVSDLPKIPDIHASYQRIRKEIYLGSQYEWLAIYAAMRELDNLELSAMADGRIIKLIGKYLQSSPEGPFTTYRMDPAASGTDEYTIFGRFSFPVMDFTKKDMERIARENGFIDLMEMTWFCHDPLPGNIPCGVCNPCSFVIQEGLGHRIPLRSRIRYYLPGKAMFIRMASQNKRIYQIASSIKNRGKTIDS